MKIGDMVRTEVYQNVGIVFERRGDYAKVLLDKHRADDILSIEKNPLFLKKSKDIDSASWYHLKELQSVVNRRGEISGFSAVRGRQ